MDIKAEIKEKIDEIVEKIKSDKNIAAKFQKDPIATVEKLIGIDLPNEQVDAVVDFIKAKIGVDKISDALGVSVSVVSKRIKQACARLETILGRGYLHG